MWPFSPRWRDPLRPSAPGTVFKSRSGLRVREVGSGDATLVFIHGLGASLRYWGRAYDALATGRRLIFVDLPGFGSSDKPAAPYDLAYHSKMVEETLAEVGVGALTVVGHSAGAAVAMHLAATSSNAVESVITFGAPIFPSEEDARNHLAKLGRIERSMAEGSQLAVRMCRFMCEHRELSRKIAPILVPRLPAGVASDGVDHTWDSLSKTFDSLVRDFAAADWARQLGDRLLLVYGSSDNIAPPRAARKTLEGSRAMIEVVEGDHHLPLYKPHACIRLIGRLIA